MSSRLNHLLFTALLLLAFTGAGYKTYHRAADSVFATTPVKLLALETTALPAKPFRPGQALGFDSQFVSSQPGQAVHAPSLVELRNGNLRAVWFSGSREGAGDVTIQTALFDAATRRWSAETTLFNRSQLQRGLLRYVKKIGNPVIARAPDESLHLWMVNVSLGGWAGSAITWARSVDEGATWSTPKRLVTSPFLNISTLVKGAPIHMADGSIALPVYHEFITKFAEVLQLNAVGQVVGKTRIPGSRTSLQPAVLVASPQTATAYMRSGQGGRVTASSTADAGKTWSRASAINLPNPDSALAALHTQSGNNWLALNPTSSGRQSLALLKSDDAGNFDTTKAIFVESANAPTKLVGEDLSVLDYSTYMARELRALGAGEADTLAYIASARRQLCHQEACVKEFSYPFLLQTRDRSMHLVYTWQRSRIKHVQLDGAALD